MLCYCKWQVFYFQSCLIKSSKITFQGFLFPLSNVYKKGASLLMHLGHGKICQKLIGWLLEMRDEVSRQSHKPSKSFLLQCSRKGIIDDNVRMLESSIVALNHFRWSYRSINPWYCSKLIRGLKLLGTRITICHIPNLGTWLA